MAPDNRFATAINALALLASRPDKLHRSEDVARSLGTNPVVIRRIFLDLSRAGLVLSHKGPNGGSKLARAANEITLRDIHQAIHPQALLRAPASPAGCHSTLKSVFSSASQAFEAELARTTLAQLAKKPTLKSKP